MDDVVRALSDDRTIDDRRAAAGHLRTAAAIKHRGRLRIARELEARGIDRSVVAEVVGQIQPDDEARMIAQWLHRKAPPGKLPPADRRRLFQQLLRRGFAADAIARALRTWGGDEDDRVE